MILGTRGSPLARAQSGWVRDRLLAVHAGSIIETRVIRTAGDQQQAIPPQTLFGTAGVDSVKGIFVKEIEDALLLRRIDLAVHSLKDLPVRQPEGLTIAAVPQREDPHDALVTRDGRSLGELPDGARVGTSSPRRAAQLAAARPDLVFVPVRGNVDTRLSRLIEGRFEAVVLAAAGLNRLGLLPCGDAGGIKAVPLSESVCVPAVGQGALAVETRRDDDATRSIVAAINDATAAAEVTAERAFLETLGGGCRVPVAALARVKGSRMELCGVVAAPGGARMVRVQGEAATERGAELGRDLALQALDQGAGAILAQVGET